MLWRVALDARIKDSLSEMRQHWCLDDLAHAHHFLDELDTAERRARLRSKVKNG